MIFAFFAAFVVEAGDHRSAGHTGTRPGTKDQAPGTKHQGPVGYDPPYVTPLILAVALLQDPCRGEGARHIETAQRLGEAFDLAGAAEAYSAAVKSGCSDARAAAIYVRGLIAARAADAQFGSTASLQPLREAIGALEPYAATDPVARAMQAVVRAAMPAAQHERGELTLLIDEMLRHESLQLEARLPGLPVISAHEAAGYFWLQLHLYDEATRAFDAAGRRIGQTSHVMLGAARAAAGRQDVAAACGHYNRLVSWWGTPPATPPEIVEARGFLNQRQCAALPVPPGTRR